MNEWEKNQCSHCREKPQDLQFWQQQWRNLLGNLMKTIFLSFIINRHDSTAAVWISARVEVGAEAKKKKEAKQEKEKSVYGEKNQTVTLSGEVIVMQARSDIESHNYTECKISRSKWIMKIQPFFIIYACHQNNISITRRCWWMEACRDGAQGPNPETPASHDGKRGHTGRMELRTSQRSSFNLGYPVRMMIEVRRKQQLEKHLGPSELPDE